MKVHSLNIYPVKSCRGVAVKKLNFLADGPAGDREWMLVDEGGNFLSQRTLGRMAQIETVLDETHLTLAFGGGFFKVPRVYSTPRPRSVKIWNTECVAHEEPLLYSEAISQFLGVKCFLVRYTPETKRMMKPVGEFAPETRFTDRGPIQLVNLKSLEDLNGRLPQEVPVGRFRANVIFKGKEAFEEENWKRIRIGPVTFSQPKKCGRCKVITLDERTGEATGPEPLKTLSGYRRDESNKVCFGVIWTPENLGVISIGDKVEILD